MCALVILLQHRQETPAVFASFTDTWDIEFAASFLVGIRQATPSASNTYMV